MQDVLETINRKTNKYVLKGGTSLMMCYGLDRFSEDIDFDSTDYETLGPLLKQYASQHGYSVNVNKYIQTVQRYMLHYGVVPDKPLKIETSFRNKIMHSDSIQTVGGICVYKPEAIFRMKLGAYEGRDKIRDLYDIIFIFKKYKDQLLGTDLEQAQAKFAIKDMSHIDYLLETSEDPLVDKIQLRNDVLDMLDELGLIPETRSCNKVPDLFNEITDAYDALNNNAGTVCDTRDISDKW